MSMNRTWPISSFTSAETWSAIGLQFRRRHRLALDHSLGAPALFSVVNRSTQRALGLITHTDRMAQIFGEPSRNAAEQSFRRTRRLFVAAFVAIGALATLGGYGIGAAFPTRGFPAMWVLVIAALLFVLMWLISKWATDKIDAIDRQRLAWRKGAMGEALVAAALQVLPDEFVVVNDVSNTLSNIDHV